MVTSRARKVTANVVLVAALVTAACGAASGGSGSGGSSPAGGGSELVVFAASSLTEAFGELEKDFEAAHQGVDVRLSFESSSTLARQIVEGAPADVFASADMVQMGVVEDQGLVEDPVTFATNRLVVVTPAENPAGIQTPADVANQGVKLVLAGPEVPAGNYSRAMLERLGVAEEAEANVVSNEEDVKAVVAKVRLGEADAGVVYRTDVTDEVAGDLELIEVPAEVSPLAVYPITVLTETDNPDAASAWVELVLSPQGQRALKDHAFGPPER